MTSDLNYIFHSVFYLKFPNNRKLNFYQMSDTNLVHTLWRLILKKHWHDLKNKLLDHPEGVLYKKLKMPESGLIYLTHANVMGRWPFQCSCMDVSYCTFRFGAIIQCYLGILSLLRVLLQHSLNAFKRLSPPRCQ